MEVATDARFCDCKDRDFGGQVGGRKSEVYVACVDLVPLPEDTTAAQEFTAWLILCEVFVAKAQLFGSNCDACRACVH